MKSVALALILAVALASGGCIHGKSVPIPGAVNQFDSDTYLVLVTAKAAIDQAKSELANNAFASAAIAANVKRSINVAVAAYNTADVTYQAYHTSALNGTATPSQQAAVTDTLNNLNTTVVAITSAKGGQ